MLRSFRLFWQRAAFLSVLGTLCGVASAQTVLESSESERGPSGPIANFFDGIRDANGWKNGATSVGEPLTQAGRPTFWGGSGGGFELEIALGFGEDEFPLASAATVANETELSPCCSNWARFAPGSWARSRTTSVAYENGKAIQSVTETRITLEKVDVANRFYELRYDATIKMGGGDYPKRSETVRYDFWDVPLDGVSASETLDPVNLLIARKAIPCERRRVVRTTPQGQETTTLWFSPVVAPYVLQKETTRAAAPDAANGTSGTSGTPLARELSVVQKTSAHLLLGGDLTSYVAASSAQKGRRFAKTSTVYSTSRPGGVVRETTTETDPNGVVLYRSTTVLLDYYVAY